MKPYMALQFQITCIKCETKGVHPAPCHNVIPICSCSRSLSFADIFMHIVAIMFSLCHQIVGIQIFFFFKNIELKTEKKIIYI